MGRKRVKVSERPETACERERAKVTDQPERSRQRRRRRGRRRRRSARAAVAMAVIFYSRPAAGWFSFVPSSTFPVHCCWIPPDPFQTSERALCRPSRQVTVLCPLALCTKKPAGAQPVGDWRRRPTCSGPGHYRITLAPDISFSDFELRSVLW